MLTKFHGHLFITQILMHSNLTFSANDFLITVHKHSPYTVFAYFNHILHLILVIGMLTTFCFVFYYDMGLIQLQIP